MPNYNSKTPLEETFDKSNIFSKVDNSNTELSFTQPERTIPAEVIPSTPTKEKKKQTPQIIDNLPPENVQLTSIENTSGTHVVINAQSNKYEQLGYLKAKIKADVILTNVISTAGQKDNNIVTVKIEGDLP